MRFTRIVFSFTFAGLTTLLAQAPTVDRVGFPTNYNQTFTKLLQVDRTDNGQIRIVWANSEAAATKLGEDYPYGSVMLFESWTSKRDSAGVFLRDADGHLIPDSLSTIFVKRKEPGFGEAYGENRNGEWEYVAYRPDGSTQTAPAQTAACAACHAIAGSSKDFTFRRDRFQHKGNGVAPLATISQYTFVPGDLWVQKGTLVTWYNDDEIEHNIAVAQLQKRSTTMRQGATYQVQFDEPGEYEIRCTIHAGMRQKVLVHE
jgi:plastocyanin